MSSHHIVRDKQEPGLLLLKWEPGTPMLLDQLCQWCPIIVVDETCVSKFLELGLKLNVVVNGGKAMIGELQYQAPLDFMDSHHEVIESVEKTVMEELHVLGVFPWEKKSNESHVFYKNGRRFSKIQSDLSIWVGEGEHVRIFSSAGKLIETLEGEDALMEFGEFEGLWLERSY